MIAAANASRDAQINGSNNMLLATQTQAAVMELGIMEGSQNAHFQTLAWLTNALDTNDMKREITRADIDTRIQEEQDKHQENMKGLDIREKELNQPQPVDTSNFTA